MLSPKQLGRIETVPNSLTGGTVTLANRVETHRAVLINQTTPGQTLALPNPVDASIVFGVDVINVGTAGFTIGGELCEAGAVVRVVWDGAAYSVLSGGAAATTPLHYANVAGTGNNWIAGAATVIGAGYFVFDIDAATLTTYDPQTLINTTQNCVTIEQAGLYEIIWSPQTQGTTAVFGIYLNGTRIASSNNVQATDQGSSTMVVIRSLIVGDRLEFGATASTGSGLCVAPSFSVKQLAASTMVDPGTVPVETLHYGRLSTADNRIYTPVVGTAISSYETSGPNNVGLTANATTGTITVAQAGIYEVFARTYARAVAGNATIQIGVYVNGVLALTGPANAVTNNPDSEELIVTGRLSLVANDAVTIRPIAISGAGWQQGVFELRQVPTSTVIDTGGVAVNDQTGSGYFDIGAMRVQWGTSTNNGTQTNFPASFANASYSVVITPAGIGNLEHRIDNRATNGYTASFFTSGGGGTGGAASQHYYIAIGLKP